MGGPRRVQQRVRGTSIERFGQIDLLVSNPGVRNQLGRRGATVSRRATGHPVVQRSAGSVRADDEFVRVCCQASVPSGERGQGLHERGLGTREPVGDLNEIGRLAAAAQPGAQGLGGGLVAELSRSRCALAMHRSGL